MYICVRLLLKSIKTLLEKITANINSVNVHYNDLYRRVNTRVTHLAGHGRMWRPKIGIVKAGFSHPEINTQGS